MGKSAAIVNFLRFLASRLARIFRLRWEINNYGDQPRRSSLRIFPERKHGFCQIFFFFQKRRVRESVRKLFKCRDKRRLRKVQLRTDRPALVAASRFQARIKRSSRVRFRFTTLIAKNPKNEENPSFSHTSFHHFGVTRLPNHWWATSCAAMLAQVLFKSATP